MELTKTITDIKFIKRTIIVLIGTFILALSARLQTPLAPVPATMQTFAVLLLGIMLGYKLAFISVLIYLIQGALGLPVFAAGGGIIYFTGPTSGYLFGFLLGAFFSGKIRPNQDSAIVFFKLLFSVSFIYMFGIIWLWFFKGLSTNFNEIFAIGAKPFLLIELYKLLILAVLSNLIFKIRPFI
jgi:biotin transport system substrate-specific component|tara:strand:- start:7441 stop:7989 length:549 start_codon:yes stop_codon:yes gene_type:complete